MRLFWGFILLLFSCSAAAQSYSTALIPDSLMVNVDVVKRFESLSVVIKSNSKAVVKRKYVITILNSNGDDWATYINGYSQIISLTDITGKLYDATGNLVKSVKKRDIVDMSVNDDVSILTDARYKRYSFYHKVYPYTVEFEDEQVYDGLFFLPKWTPVSSTRMSVIHSSLEIETPIDYQVRYKQFNYQGEPLIVKNNTIRYSWGIKNQYPINVEPLGPSWDKIVPAVYIAATDFQLGEYKGNMSTWKSFGKFIYNLNNGKDILNGELKQKVRALTSGITSIKEKVQVLYNYLQKNTRYVSIQLGIGSWQPFDANYVALNKYGDCKALSNFMVSLLKEAGVKSHYVLINAGENARELYEDFSSAVFNHAIVCVPNGKDTIWLECTSQTVPPGYLGTFTNDRKALLIDEDGGYIVKTPAYRPTDNLQVRRVEGVLNEKGDLFIKVKTKFTAEQQELQHNLIHESSPEDRLTYLNKVISLPTYKVVQSSYFEKRDALPEIVEELQIEATSYASVTAKRIFITPNLFNKSSSKLPDLEFRKQPILLQLNYLDIDTVQISFPPNYTIESMPKSVILTSSFGNYSLEFSVKQNAVEMIRKYMRAKDVLPADKYTEVQNFFDAVRRADHARLVLLKKE